MNPWRRLTGPCSGRARSLAVDRARGASRTRHRPYVPAGEVCARSRSADSLGFAERVTLRACRGYLLSGSCVRMALCATDLLPRSDRRSPGHGPRPGRTACPQPRFRRRSWQRCHQWNCPVSHRGGGPLGDRRFADLPTSHSDLRDRFRHDGPKCGVPSYRATMSGARDYRPNRRSGVDTSTVAVAPPNRRLKLAGASAGRGIERLVLSKTRSLTRRIAWCTFAPAA